ncbi:MAG: hypothetical protein Q8O07_04385, partial [Chloroflexota bacterium]|nr:hypothetical protein [Chloroflexota bacterium]
IRRAQGYIYLAAGIVTAGLFLFVLSSPDAWASPVNGYLMAALGLGLSVIDFIVAYGMLRRPDLPAPGSSARGRPDHSG